MVIPLNKNSIFGTIIRLQKTENQKHMQENKDNGEYNYLIDEADKLKMSGEHQQAIKVCEKILAQDLDFEQAYEELGDNFLSLKEYDKAEKALIQALRINPQSANAHYLIGFTHSALSNWFDSIEHLETADRLQSNHPEVLRCLGWSIFHSGKRKQGLIILERALNLNPKDPLILSDLGICYLNDKNFNRADELFKKVLEIDPENKKVKECLYAVRFFKSEFKKFRESNKNYN